MDTVNKYRQLYREGKRPTEVLQYAMDHFMVDPERPGNALDLFLKAFNLDVGKGQLITAWLLKAPDISTEKIDELLQKYIERQRGVWKKSEK